MNIYPKFFDLLVANINSQRPRCKPAVPVMRAHYASKISTFNALGFREHVSITKQYCSAVQAD